MFKKLERIALPRKQKIFLFLLLFWGAVIFSKNIIIPYSNELGVSGPLTLIKFNPLNNTLRFLFIVFFPAAIYFVIFFIRRILVNIKFSKEKDISKGVNNRLENKRLPYNNTANGLDKKVVLLVIFILFLFFHLGFSTFNDKPLDTFHEGESLGTAIDYQSNKKPYKDTVFIHGVFQDPVRSIIAFKLFGKSISSQRLLVSILNIIVCILFFTAVFFLFDLQIVYGVFAGIVLFLFLDVGYNIPFRDISTYLFIIVVSLFYNKFIKKLFDKSFLNKKKTPFFCFLTFLCFFIPTASFANSIDRGLYSFASAIFLFLITVILLYRKKKAFPLFISSAASGFIAGLAVILIAIKGALYEFFNFTFIVMPSFKELLDAFVYEFNGRNLIPVALFSMIVFWIGDRFLMSILNKNIKFFDRIKSFIATYYMELFLIFLSLAFFKGALGRCDIGHILYVSAPLFIAVVYISIKNSIGLRENNSRIFYSLTLIVLLTVVVSNLFKHDFSREENWWKFSTNIKDEELMPKSHKNTVEFLKNNLKEDEYFLTMTSEGTWYYFVDKPCPIKFPITVVATPKFYQKEVINQLKEKKDKIKYIIYKNNLWTNNFDFIPNEKRYSHLIKYIKKNYRFSQMIDDQEIWEIKKQ